MVLASPSCSGWSTRVPRGMQSLDHCKRRSNCPHEHPISGTYAVLQFFPWGMGAGGEGDGFMVGCRMESFYFGYKNDEGMKMAMLTAKDYFSYRRCLQIDQQSGRSGKRLHS